MECIQCGLCIDACDKVMAKVGRPPRLIAYDTDENCAAAAAARRQCYRISAPSTVLYGLLIVASPAA